jgi:hypothetical protein
VSTGNLNSEKWGAGNLEFILPGILGGSGWSTLRGVGRFGARVGTVWGTIDFPILWAIPGSKRVIQG